MNRIIGGVFQNIRLRKMIVIDPPLLLIILHLTQIMGIENAVSGIFYQV